MALMALVISHMALAESFSAVVRHDSGAVYEATNQANSTAASMNALQSCRQTHATDAAECELTELNGRKLITSADIRARLPDIPHPLYLWRFAHEDVVVYLAGSIHILKPGFYPLAPQFEAAFNQSDHLVLEVDSGRIDPATMQALSLKYGQLPAPKTLTNLLSESTYRALAAYMREYGVELSFFETFKPNFINQQLTILALQSIGYEAEAGVENHFRRRNEREGNPRKVLQLETVEFQLDLLFNAPLPTQVQLADATLAQMETFEEITADLITAWLAGDDELFALATEAQSGETPELKAFTESLINKRNHGMADTIAGYMDGEAGTYFVLVGSAHLIGKQGIPNLLVEKGYPANRYRSDSQVF